MDKFIAYLRVSTVRQGKSGLGLEAQQENVAAYLRGHDGTLMAEFVEVESGKRDARPELAKALAQCKMTGATLIVAKLDRLSRNQSFLMNVYEGTGEGGVVFCDLPTIPAGPVGKFIVQQMAAVAELERGLISQRTKAALAQSTKKLGGYRGGPHPDYRQGCEAQRIKADEFADRLAPVLAGLERQEMTLAQMAQSLTEQGIQTARGGKWTPSGVRAIQQRLGTEL